MPQFDTFIFSSNLFYFILSFFILLYVNFNYILPKYGALLKLRVKIFINHYILYIDTTMRQFNILNKIRSIFSNYATGANNLNYNYHSVFLAGILGFSFYMIHSEFNRVLLDIFSHINIITRKISVILSLFLSDDDSFAILVGTITVIVLSEILYYHVTGHNSYLFTKLVYDPNHLSWKSNTPGNTGGTFYSSFDFIEVPFEALFVIMIPVCIILTFVLMFVVSNTFKKIGNVFYFILPIFIVTLIFFYSPAIMLIGSIFLAAVILLIEFYPISSQNDYKNLFYNYLWDTNILPFFIRLHSIVFYTSTSLTFIFLLFSTYLLSFFYVVLSRYYLYYTVASPKHFSYFYLILVLIGIFSCLSAFVLRLFINISNNLVFNIKANHPSLWAHILLMEPNLDPDSVVQPKPVSNSIFSFHRHHHRYNIPPNRFSVWQKAGFTVGVCTLAVGCVAAYYSYNSYLQAVRSADAAFESNRLHRISSANQHPDQAANIFCNHPQEYQKWKDTRGNS
jgi:hypothetical protein